MPPPNHVTLLTYPGPTSTPAFPGLEPLDDRAIRRCRAVSSSVHDLSRADTLLCAPEPAAQQAARALDLTPVIDAELAAPELGRWTGHTLERVADADPEGLSVWLSDPHSTPHGGESLTALVVRVGAWCDALDGGRALAVVHTLTARAAAAHALDAGAGTMMHIDLAPLSVLWMTRRDDRWRLQRLGRLERETT